VHGVGGAVGTILLGVFALRAWNPGGADGLLAGNAAFFGKQLLAVGVGIGYAVVGTLVLLKLVNAVVGLRVGAEEEHEAWTSTCTARKATTWAWVSRPRAAPRPFAESAAESAVVLPKRPPSLA